MSDFDSLGYAQKLREVGVPQEQAEAEAALIRDQVLALAATKGDLVSLQERLATKVDHTEERLNGQLKQLDLKIDHVEERLRLEIAQLGQKTIITLGSMIVVATGIILAAQRYL